MKFFEKDWIYDLETYKDVFTFCVISSNSLEGHVFEISSRKDNRDIIFQFLDNLADTNSRLVGFNNVGFDYPILHFLLNNRDASSSDIYEEAQRIIQEARENRFANTISNKKQYVKQLDLYRINHFDNPAKSTSLKVLEFNLCMDNIQELPYDIDSVLTSDQIDDIIDYNMNDVIATLKFYYQCYSAIELRNNLSLRYGIDFTNMSDSKIGSEIFINQLETAKPGSCFKFDKGKRVPRQTRRNIIHLSQVILPYIQFKRPEFQAILDWFRTKSIRETNGVFSDILESDLGDVAKYARMVVKRSKKMEKQPTEEEIALFRQEIPLAELEIRELRSGKKSYYYTWKVAENLNVVINNHEYVFGVGGIHSSIESKKVVSDENYTICDFDVSSYYPNLAIRNTIYPKHLSEQFCVSYEAMYEERKKYAKNDPFNASLKLALNSTYGNSNNQYSPFYDPQYTMTITINGQLSLCMLIERILELQGSSSIQSNTDGITMCIRNEDSNLVNSIVKEWEQETKLEMERNDYSIMWIRDVNNYVAKYKDGGKLKTKGAYEITNEHHKDQSAKIVQKAVNAYFADNIDVEQFIRNHTNKYDFMLRTKLPRTFSLYLVDNNGERYLQQNVCRYYVSISPNAKEIIKEMPPSKNKVENRISGICVDRKVIVCNNIQDFAWDIDYDYYIKETNKLLDIFNEKGVE